MKSVAARSKIMHIKANPTFRARLSIGLVIFLLAFGVRVLSWHDTRLEVGKVQTVVTADYQRVAELIHDGGIRSFFSSASPLADLNDLGHPPGYSFLIAAIYAFKHTYTAIQFAQITADALSAVLIFLIVAELFRVSAGVIAGLLAAFSPQFAWNSVLLLPDSISVLPILLAIYLLARAIKRPQFFKFLVVGALVGASCWLRANAMFLTLFVAGAVPLVIRFGVPPSGGAPRKRGTPNRRQAVGAPWRFALAVVMTQRCSSMLRLERSRLTSLDPSISHSIETIDKMQPVWSAEPAQLLNRAVVLSSETQTSLVSDTCCWLTLMGDDSRYGDQFASPLASVKQDFDYVLVVPIDAFRGRMRISVKSSTGKTYSTAIVEAFEPISTADHGLQRIALPFVPRDTGQPQIVFSNEASNPPNPIVTVTEIELYEL